jgi:hypothetical protein
MMQTRTHKDVFNALHPRYINATDGEALVALPKKEFEMLLETIEDWEDNMLYEQAKAEDTGERILFPEKLEKANRILSTTKQPL